MRRIQLVLSDDWELRGDGSGDMRIIQFENLRALLTLYERHGIRCSINAEAMQQLYHRQLETRHPELRVLAEEWDDTLRGALDRGHDVQLHLHSQWLGATYDDGRWHLPGSWSILTYPPETIRWLIRRGKGYLENLLQPVRPDYECVSFRSGSWCLAPSDSLLTILAEEGFTFDMSIVHGVYYDNSVVHLDYRQCEETFLPYFPDMRDARRVAGAPMPIVCLPTFSFREPLRDRMWRAVRRATNRLQTHLGLPFDAEPRAASDTPVRSSGTQPPKDYTIWEPAELRAGILGKVHARIFPKIKIADIAQLPLPLLIQMISAIRVQADRSGWPVIPVIIENHTKDIGDFGPIEAFVKYLSAQKDLEVITPTEVHRNLKAGVYRPLWRGKE